MTPTIHALSAANVTVTSWQPLENYTAVGVRVGDLMTLNGFSVWSGRAGECMVNAPGNVRKLHPALGAAIEAAIKQEYMRRIDTAEFLLR